MTEEEVSLDLLSEITCDFSLQRYSEKEDGFYCTLLIAAFDGEYRHGSEGNDDADYMSAMLNAAFAVWQPLALVLDLRKLSYEWGDMMDAPLTAGQSYRAWMGGLPTVAISSSRNERALHSLIDQVMSEDPAAWLFPTREDAIARVLEKYKAQRAAAGYT